MSVSLPNARAEDVSGAYLVKDVQVDVLDESAVKARDKAFELAQEKAYGILAERFRTLEKNSVDKLPTTKVLSSLVQDFEIVDEQTSLKRYRGTYNFRFRPAAVRGFFGHGPTNFDGPNVKAPPKKVLLIPYFANGSMVNIWAKEFNPLLTALQYKLQKSETVLLPAGDVLDRTDIKETDPHLISSTTIKRLKARYDASDVVIAYAEVRKQDPHKMTVSLLRTDRGLIEDVTQSTYTETQPPQKGDANIFIQAAIKVFHDLDGNWKDGGTENPPEQKPESASPAASTQDPATRAGDINPTIAGSNASPAASALRAALGNPALGVNPQAAGQQQPQTYNVAPQIYPAAPVAPTGTPTTFRLYFTGIPQWLDMQKQLRSLPSVLSLEVISMKNDQVDLRVIYEEWPPVETALKQRGFQVEPTSEGYILRRTQGKF